MRNLEGGNAPKGIEKFKGFVGMPEYKARHANIDQIKQMTPKDLGELGKSVMQAQGEPVSKILLEQGRQVGERRQMMQMFSRILKMTPEEFGDFLENQPNRDNNEGYDKRRGSLTDRVLEQIVLDHFEPKKSSS
jgi:hypothetical protein